MSPQTKNPFFAASDLQKLEFRINGTNQTSRLPLPKDQIQLIQILEDGLWLSFPLRSCAMGHMIALEVWARKEMPMEEAIEQRAHITAIVKEVDESSAHSLLVRVFFREHNQAQWDTLIRYFSERQTAINTLVKNTRG